MLIKYLSLIIGIVLIGVIISIIAVKVTRRAANTVDATISSLVTNGDGKTYYEVDGRPMLYNAVQCWWSPWTNNAHHDYTMELSKAAEAGYKIVSLWYYWRHMEPLQGRYHCTDLDHAIDSANKYDIRLEIIWGGSTFCGQLDPRWVPDYILSNHTLHKRDDSGSCIKVNGDDMGRCCAPDLLNIALQQYEKNALQVLMDHLYSYDRNHRVIAIQIENEMNLDNWCANSLKDCANYCSIMCGVVKNSDYKIITRTNWSGATPFNDPFSMLANLDCHGADPYSSSVTAIRDAIANNTSKFPHIAENSSYENTTTLIIAALAKGGGYHIYKIDYDAVWNNPGVYDNNWSYAPRTYKIKQLNTALNKAYEVIATSPKTEFYEFNTEDDNPSSSYNVKKSINGWSIGMKSDGNASVGMAIRKGDYIYCIADSNAYFNVDSATTVEEGYQDSSGNWVKNSDKTLTIISSTEYQIAYNINDCIRIHTPQ